MTRMLAAATGWIALGAVWAAQVDAHSLTLAECNEGGEFIRNAALARDNGMTREFFVGRLEEDLSLIKAFPPSLRWFVQDSGDEKLLTEAVLDVFDFPVKAEQHEAAFVRTCLAAAVAAQEEHGII